MIRGLVWPAIPDVEESPIGAFRSDKHLRLNNLAQGHSIVIDEIFYIAGRIGARGAPRGQFEPCNPYRNVDPTNLPG